ncbi:DUF2891 domain-containing protein, partial [Glaciimonas sp. GG7]
MIQPSQPSQPSQQLTPALASTFANMVLGHITQEYPNKLTHTLNSAADVQNPRALYPIFYGSYDWHSCVHGYWLLVRLLTRYPALPEAAAIRSLLDRQFTQANVCGELAYLAAPSRAGFERPYGWGWLLALQSALVKLDSLEGQRWARTLSPLADAFVALFVDFLPKATYPVRVGTHFNTAFALTLALEYARTVGNAGLEADICAAARRWHGRDVGCQAWEPSGDEFLSPALMVAVLMRQVLSAAEFEVWFSGFLPDLVRGEPVSLFTPATVSDRSDGKIAHLDGLNFSRAWCQRSIARGLPFGENDRYGLRVNAVHEGG